MATVQFCGAAREVTGSMHVLECDGKLIALDCGLFQGRRSETAAKNKSFRIKPADVHAVVLSHAHIDHAGRLPMLVRQGFSGRIYATPATRDLCAIMLADSAHIQQEDARYLNKKRARTGEPPIEPLYMPEDAVAAVKLFQTVSYDMQFRVSKSIQVTFFETGHMLGSAGVRLLISEPDRPPVRLVFSGDVGRFDLPILRDPAPIPECDYLICESTYGGRATPKADDLKAQLEAVIRKTSSRGGKVIIPAFSVGRTQSVVYYLNQLRQEGRIATIPVFVDSPLSVNATEVFRMHPECYDVDARAFHTKNGDLLGARWVTYITEVEESKALDRRRNPCVIISSSGMCESGRILHHLKNNIQSPKNTVLIVGYQGANTLGRRLVEGEKQVTIFNQRRTVRAEVVVLNGFSGHADRHELERLTSPLAGECRAAFLVHGEMDQMQALSTTMRTRGFRRVEMPEPGGKYELNGR
jgi:metallo-beta-lactamase family protein